ncbi:hypothetical protein AeRB84_014201, partial [Aphanomyces euteiches]
TTAKPATTDAGYSTLAPQTTTAAPSSTTKSPSTTGSTNPTTASPVNPTTVPTTKGPNSTNATATPSPTSGDIVFPTCTKVSVEGDATYCIAGPVCNGAGPNPAGTKCPKTGDAAVEACVSNVPSYSNGKCVAPKDAVCGKIVSGVWSCKWA